MYQFSGTSYLGLDRHPGYLELVKRGLDRFGTHYGGSRLSPHSPTIFAEAEAALAEWTGAPAALLLSSGTSAGQLAVRFLSKHYDSIHFSPFAHPASWWPAGLEYQSWSGWIHALQQGRTVGCTDGINPLLVELPPWSDILGSSPPALMIDDSHLLGCYGQAAAGSWSALRQKYEGELLINASLGKALSLPAGLLLGEKEDIEQIRSLPQFGGASPPSPAFLYAWLQGQEIVTAQVQCLQEHIGRIQELARRAPHLLGVIPGFPVISMHRHEWVEELRKRKIEVSSFRYPSPTSERYSRIVLRADHTAGAITALAGCLSELIEKALAG